MTIQGQPIELAAEAVERLPADLAFLAASGVPAHRLTVARALAEEAGVMPHEVLIRTGLVDEASYLRALAAHLGLPFLEDGAPLDPSVRFPASILYGLVRLRPNSTGALLGLAPGPQDVMRLLAQRQLPGPLAILTSTALRKGVIAADPAAVASLAANDLPDRRPALSARGGSTREQRAAFIIALALVAALCVFVKGGANLVLAGAGVVFMAVIVVRLSGLFERASTRPPRLERWPDTRLPVYTVIVPLHREDLCCTG